MKNRENSEIITEFDKFLINQEEIIQERFITSGETLTIIVQGDAGGRLSMQPYFKVYEGKLANSKTDKYARIRLDRPEYVDHYKGSKNSEWRLNSNQIQELVELLHSKPGMDCWEYIKYEVIEEDPRITKEREDKINSLKMPDYSIIYEPGQSPKSLEEKKSKK